MEILIVGPQGSGKTTQAKLLAKKFNFQFISTGDLVREFATQDSQEAQSVKQALEQGELVNDRIVAELIRKKLARNDSQRGFVMEGFPRSVDQLKYISPNFDKVFYLEVSDEEVVKRLLDRKRADDQPEVIRQRLRLYHTFTEPVLKFYEKLGKLIRINASQLSGMTDEQSIQEIANEIDKQMESLVNNKGVNLGASAKR